MKRMNIKSLALCIIIVGLQLTACKSKTTTETSTDTSTSTSVDTAKNETSAAPIEIAPDDSLKTGARDAVKDFSGVNASVNNGEVTLTGDITRDRLPKLMMAINSLHPKKINNNLTISK